MSAPLTEPCPHGCVGPHDGEYRWPRGIAVHLSAAHHQYADRSEDRHDPGDVALFVRVTPAERDRARRLVERRGFRTWAEMVRVWIENGCPTECD